MQIEIKYRFSLIGLTCIGIVLLLSVLIHIVAFKALWNIYREFDIRPDHSLIEKVVKLKAECERDLPRTQSCKVRIIAVPSIAL